MEKLKFVRPNLGLKEDALEFRQEHFDNGENELQGGALFDEIDDYEIWMKQALGNLNKKTVTKGWVLSSTFFVVRESDGKIIGMADIRHELNDYLREYSGHIGYGVRPSERRKGYGAEIFKMSLDYANSLDIDKAAAACYKDNIASAKTIEKCGGVKNREYIDHENDDRVVSVYYIET